MIDENITFILFGYTSKTLSHGSDKKVLAICNECGNERLLRYNHYKDLCASCSRKGNKHYNYGKHLSKETKHKMSKTHSGENNHFYGKHHTEETKYKMSKNHVDVSGKNNPNYGKIGNKHSMYDITGENHPNWKGGTKMTTARRHAKRKELFGFIPHNKPQENFHGHHLDFNHVIFIPKELHTSIYHSVVKNINMDIINNAVCDWYLNYQIQQKNY